MYKFIVYIMFCLYQILSVTVKKFPIEKVSSQFNHGD